MMSESVCAKSIERYVRTCGLQFLKGEHDGEYFCVASANGRRLHIHLEISPSFGDMLIIGVAPACSFRAADRPWLTQLADAMEPAEPQSHRDPARLLGSTTRRSRGAQIPVDP